MNQPIPTYSDADLDRIIARDFHAESPSSVRAVLDVYGANQRHREARRVRMACLKCANGSLEDLARYVQIACDDYRDVLAWAEYPAYLQAHGPVAQQNAIASDWSQLQEWLDRE